MRVRAMAVALFLVPMGCGGDGGAGDAGTRSDAAATGSSPQIPWLAEGAPPIAPPSFTPCPEGWREVTDGSGLTTCDPHPTGGALECPEGQAHFPGEPTCAPVGRPCAAGDFAEGLPADRRVVYVRPGAVSGDGTEASPFGSISEFSLGGLPAGSVVALSRGTHEGPVPLARGTVLQGACAGASFLRSSTPTSTEGVITARGGGGEVRDLGIVDSPGPGIWLAEAGAEIHLEGVVLTGTVGLGIIVGRGSLIANRIVVSGTRADAGGEGRGLAIEIGGEARVSRAIFEDNLAVAVRVSNAMLEMSDVVVRDTAGEVGRTAGRGVEVTRGASADISRALVEGNRDHGIFADTAGTTLTLTDVVVRDTAPNASDDMVGRGLGVEPDVVAHVQRALLERNHDVGVFLAGAETTATLTDLVVRDTQPEQSDGTGGRGLNAQLGATADVTRAVFERNHETGIFVAQDGTTASLSDVVVRDTQSAMADASAGRGMQVAFGSTADVQRAVFEGNRDVGVLAGIEGTMLSLSDVVIRNTLSDAMDLTGGRGLGIESSGTGQGSRLLIERSRDIGVLVTAGAAAQLSDLVVRDTSPQDCASTTCPGAPGGHGVTSYSAGSTVRMSRFAVQGSALCGMHIANEAALDVDTGEVSENTIGACIQIEGYDVGRISAGVRYLDNEVNLQTVDLPIPDASATLDP